MSMNAGVMRTFLEMSNLIQRIPMKDGPGSDSTAAAKDKMEARNNLSNIQTILSKYGLLAPKGGKRSRRTRHKKHTLRKARKTRRHTRRA